MHLRPLIKRALYSIAMFVGASWGILSPFIASASILSILAPSSSIHTSTPIYNSQTLPLLAPAVNLDPHPAQGGGDISLVAGEALLPQEGPSGTAANLSDVPQSSSISVYTVHPGDTLSAIAQMFGVSVNTIIWANDIQGHTIQPGQTLIILPITGVQYTVLKGDTLASVATKFKSDATDIAQFNDISSSASLAVGSTIIIPDGELSTPVATPSARTTVHRSTGSKSEPYLGGSGPALSGYFSWPLEGGIVTQGLHGWNAVDIGAPTGTSIYAAAAGTVIIAKSGGGWNGGYGNYVVVSHANGTQSLYAHMSRVLVSPGEPVGQGDVIGKVGATGEATGPHLHFEIRGALNPFASLAVGSRE